MKEFIKSIKENPKEFTEELIRKSELVTFCKLPTNGNV